MDHQNHLIESHQIFSESLIWELNKEYYQNKGIEAWRQDLVPHHLTSNAMVGRTYAKLIFAMLKDISHINGSENRVYILELGAGHGRLAFHIIKHLDKLILESQLDLPPYTYVLSDIIQSNLDFFKEHPQLQDYFNSDKLDIAFFDGSISDVIKLEISGTIIGAGDLQTPLIALANYFFDSIPNDVFYIKDKQMNICTAALESPESQANQNADQLLKSIDIKIGYRDLDVDYFIDPIFNEILELYKTNLEHSYVTFPTHGLACIKRLGLLSASGLVVLSMDKGFHQISQLNHQNLPEMITHGSMSFWVNFHALAGYCQRSGGVSFLPDSSTFHLELACLFFGDHASAYLETSSAYQNLVNDFGPDDYNTLKHHFYKNIESLSLKELLAFLRLSAYDATIFIKMIPSIKLACEEISMQERMRLWQAMHQTWLNYYTLNESFDLAFGIGSTCYKLGFFQDAIDFFNHSLGLMGPTPDVYYNKALCHYQLREDTLFSKTLKEAKVAFPDFVRFQELDELDLAAE